MYRGNPMLGLARVGAFPVLQLSLLRILMGHAKVR